MQLKVLWQIKNHQVKNNNWKKNCVITISINQNMPNKWFSLFLGLFALSLTHVTSSTSSTSGELFTSSFLVRFKRSVDSKEAHDIARRNGFHNIGAVSTNRNQASERKNLFCFCWIIYVHRMALESYLISLVCELLRYPLTFASIFDINSSHVHTVDR